VNIVSDPIYFKSLNSLQYRAFERELKGYLQQGSNVEGDFTRVFNPNNNTNRPDKFIIKYRIDGGNLEKRIFFNKEGG
jgi:hypothetical protein